MSDRRLADSHSQALACCVLSILRLLSAGHHNTVAQLLLQAVEKNRLIKNETTNCSLGKENGIIQQNTCLFLTLFF